MKDLLKYLLMGPIWNSEILEDLLSAYVGMQTAYQVKTYSLVLLSVTKGALSTVPMLYP